MQWAARSVLACMYAKAPGLWPWQSYLYEQVAPLHRMQSSHHPPHSANHRCLRVPLRGSLSARFLHPEYEFGRLSVGLPGGLCVRRIFLDQLAQLVESLSCFSFWQS